MTSQKSYSYDGKFNLIIGCMFSGKTSMLINRYNRYSIGGKKCLMIKYEMDKRYSDKETATHDGIKVQATSCKLLVEIKQIVDSGAYDVICIDEVQFFQDAPIYIDIWANNGLIVEACGLNGTFERKSFPIMSQLIPLANSITHLTAICKQTGKKGCYTKRLTDNKEQIVIGGANMYQAVDRKTFFEDIKKIDIKYN